MIPLDLYELRAVCIDRIRAENAKIARLQRRIEELKFAGHLCYAEARKRSLSDGTPETIDALIAWETLQSKGDST